MALYSLAVRTATTTTGAACWELRSTGTDRLFIREIGIFLSAATASTFGIGRPAAIGVTPTTPITWLAEDPGDPAGTGQVATAWGTGPTIPANFLRRFGIPASIGAGIVFQFGGRGLVVPVSSSLIIWNLSAVAASDVYVLGDE